MKHLVLIRHYDTGKETVGTLHVFNQSTEVAKFATVELPWKDNQRKISCIPPGEYLIEPRTTEKFGRHLWVRDVPGRDGILIHAGNFFSQIEGCILVGLHHADLNRDGELDTVSSRAALELLVQFVPSPASLIVVGAGNRGKPE